MANAPTLTDNNTDELVNAVRRVAIHVQGGARTGLTGTLPAGVDEEARAQSLIKQAVELLRTGRSDPDTLRVFAELVQLRSLDTNTLVRLAEVFLTRRDWRTLRLICDRLERQSKSSPETK